MKQGEFIDALTDLGLKVKPGKGSYVIEGRAPDCRRPGFRLVFDFIHPDERGDTISADLTQAEYLEIIRQRKAKYHHERTRGEGHKEGSEPLTANGEAERNQQRISEGEAPMDAGAVD